MSFTALMPDGTPIHVNRAERRRYVIFVRSLGCRNYRRVGGKYRSKARAAALLGEHLVEGNYKRGYVAWFNDIKDDWYGVSPPVLEMRRI